MIICVAFLLLLYVEFLFITGMPLKLKCFTVVNVFPNTVCTRIHISRLGSSFFIRSRQLAWVEEVLVYVIIAGITWLFMGNILS